MIRLEHLLGDRQVVADLGRLFPGDREDPVEIVAHHRRLGGHGRHLAQLLQLALRLLPCLLGELGRLDPLLELGQLVLAVLAVAELLLDRAHLLVEVVLALSLLHLALDARADALLDLQDRYLTLHDAEHLLEPLHDGRGRQDLLLDRNLHDKVRRDRVGELGVILDLADGRDDLRRDLLVQLHVVLELGNHRAGERLRLRFVVSKVDDGDYGRLEEVPTFGEALDASACCPFDKHLDGAVGKLQELEHGRERADLEEALLARIIVARLALGHEEDLVVRPHHFLERANRLLAADEERHHHVREHDDVTQRQHRVGGARARRIDLAAQSLCVLGVVRLCHSTFLFSLAPARQ